jgi:hypothetical protein
VESLLGLIVAIVTAVTQGMAQLYKFFSGKKREEAEQKQRKHMTQLLTRFLMIFEVQEIPRTLIPRVLDRQVLSVQQACTDELLVGQLTDELIRHTAAFFALSSEWLYGSRHMPYQVRSNYKYPGDALDTITALLEANKQAHPSSAFLLATSTHEIEGTNSDQAILSVFLEVPVSEIEGVEIKRIYVLENHLPWQHPSARIYFKQLVLLARLLGLFVIGHEVPNRKQTEFEEGQLFPHQLLTYRKKMWYPDDYIDSEKSSYVAKDSDESAWIRKDFLDSGLRDRALKTKNRLNSEYESSTLVNFQENQPFVQ